MVNRTLRKVFNDDGGCPPSPIANTCSTIPGFILPENMDQRYQDAGAAGAKGMADGYCSAMDIYRSRVQFHPSCIFDADNGKGFVEFPVTNVFHLQSRLGYRFWNSNGRSRGKPLRGLFGISI